MNCVNFYSLKERLLSFLTAASSVVILEFEESGDEIKSVLVDVQAERLNGDLVLLVKILRCSQSMHLPLKPTPTLANPLLASLSGALG